MPNDADLLRALHDEHAKPLWAYVVGLTGGDRGRAEDVVQETLLRAWRQPGVLDQSTRSARSWLFTVAKRIVIDDWRKSRVRREVITDEPPERIQPDSAEQSVNRRIVISALGRLSRQHQEILLECYYKDSTVAEASIKLGVPPGTIKSRTHYALRAFKIAVDEMGGAV